MSACFRRWAPKEPLTNTSPRVELEDLKTRRSAHNDNLLSLAREAADDRGRGGGRGLEGEVEEVHDGRGRGAELGGEKQKEGKILSERQEERAGSSREKVRRPEGGGGERAFAFARLPLARSATAGYLGSTRGSLRSVTRTRLGLLSTMVSRCRTAWMEAKHRMEWYC